MSAATVVVGMWDRTQVTAPVPADTRPAASTRSPDTPNAGAHHE
jgi:hypothetical protein